MKEYDKIPSIKEAIEIYSNDVKMFYKNDEDILEEITSLEYSMGLCDVRTTQAEYSNLSISGVSLYTKSYGD